LQIPLHRLSAVRLAQLIADGQASSEVVTRSFIDAIHEREAQVQAFAWFDADRAIAAAREMHLVSRRGPLHGLPIAIKDNIDTTDLPTSYGSTIYDGHRPAVDAVCVSLLKDAGCFVLGKTVTAELANFTPGPTRNPHGLEHTPGGSSSGSAAAVAAHMAPIALGTQTAGSVIRPAAYCGVAAYKPSARMIARPGVKPNSDTLDEVGCFARSVEDLAFAAGVLAAKPGWRELPAQGLAGAAPAIGAVVMNQRSAAAPSMLAALEAAVHRLTQRGARWAEITWPRVFDGLYEAQRIVQTVETARALAAEYSYRRSHLSVRLVELIEQGRGTAMSEYIAALQLGRACAAAIESLFGPVDVLLAPSAPGEAPRGIGSTGDPVFNRPWQLLGCPVINLPVPHALGHGETGLPLGISVVARPGEDARLFAAAAWIEQQLGGAP
jgi:Asp-tRNA(Asn)/Glu-tRNA(Gln) amidotransferase A subunit family amidase